jgi:hypothetical protein
MFSLFISNVPTSEELSNALSFSAFKMNFGLLLNIDPSVEDNVARKIATILNL